jgi:hypothetical protein
MFVNCTGQMIIDKLKIDTVNEFKYLGLMLANFTCKPDIMLKARIVKA